MSLIKQYRLTNEDGLDMPIELCPFCKGAFHPYNGKCPNRDEETKDDKKWSMSTVRQNRLEKVKRVEYARQTNGFVFLIWFLLGLLLSVISSAIIKEYLDTNKFSELGNWSLLCVFPFIALTIVGFIHQRKHKTKIKKNLGL